MRTTICALAAPTVRKSAQAAVRRGFFMRVWLLGLLLIKMRFAQ
jgi:hypothetical protein